MAILRKDLAALNQLALQGAAVVSLGHPIVTAAMIASSRLRLAHFLSLSDSTVYDTAAGLGVKAYFDAPRISIVRMGGSDTSELTQAIDLRNNTLPRGGRPRTECRCAGSLEIVRGGLDTFFESAVIASASQGEAQLTGVASADRILAERLMTGIPLLLLQPGDTHALDGLDLGPHAEALISEALAAGHLVITPQQPVPVDGVLRVGRWYETDTLTGETIGVLEDGGHQAITEYSAAIWLGFRAGIAFDLVAEGAEFVLRNLGRKGKLAGLGVSGFFSALPVVEQFGNLAPGLGPIFVVSWGMGYLIGKFLTNQVEDLLKKFGIDPAVLLSCWTRRWRIRSRDRDRQHCGCAVGHTRGRFHRRYRDDAAKSLSR